MNAVVIIIIIIIIIILLLFLYVYVVGQCNRALGMQTGEIPDSAITASSYLPDRGPSSARYVSDTTAGHSPETGKGETDAPRLKHTYFTNPFHHTLLSSPRTAITDWDCDRVFCADCLLRLRHSTGRRRLSVPRVRPFVRSSRHIFLYHDIS